MASFFISVVLHDSRSVADNISFELIVGVLLFVLIGFLFVLLFLEELVLGVHLLKVMLFLVSYCFFLDGDFFMMRLP